MNQIVSLTPAVILADQLKAVGLYAGGLWKGKAGNSKQIRQELLSVETRCYVAFFCQFTVPENERRKTPEKTCIYSFLNEKGVGADQRRVANIWLAMMHRQYEGLPFSHSSY